MKTRFTMRHVLHYTIAKRMRSGRNYRKEEIDESSPWERRDILVCRMTPLSNCISHGHTAAAVLPKGR